MRNEWFEETCEDSFTWLQVFIVWAVSLVGLIAII